jgi:2-polyprenyl-6-methoxyphenol hydroxylase-like FAD-dependent oxidoreductase
VVEGEFGPAGEVWGRRTLVGVTPVAPGQTNWYVALGAPEHTRPDLPALRERFKTWPDPIPEVLAAAQEESLLRHDLSDLAHPLSSYVTRNVVLVGDAAHAMAPSLGQGACQALVDADCLAEALAAAPNVTTALQSYDQQRRRPTQRLAKASRLMCQIQAL